MRKVSLIVVAVAILALASFGAFASWGKCPGDKAGDAKACTHGKDDKACSAHQKDMMAAYDQLAKDLAAMEKGIPAADQAAFMKAHQENLKKFVDAHNACQKECQMKKDAPKAETKDAPKK